MSDHAENAGRWVEKSVLIAQANVYKEIMDRCTGVQWKLVRYTEIINYCSERRVEIETRIKAMQ